MRSAEPLWRALEGMPILSGVREEWRRVAGEDLPAIEPWLRPMAGLAGSFPCPDAVDEACPRGVVVHGDDDIVAVCRRSPRACETVALRRDDVVVHRLDLRLLARSIGELLRVQIEQPVAVDGLARTFLVGSHGADAASRVAVYLTLQHERAELVAVADRLAVRTAGGFVLLTATTAAVTPDLAGFLRARGASILALSDLTALDDGARLIASADAEPLLRESGGALRVGASDGCVFQKQGKTWRLVFEGVTRGVRHSNGMDYIAELLRNPNSEIHSARLRDVVAGERPRALGSAGDVLDTEALREIKKRLDANKAEQEEAAELQDEVRQEKLQEEFDALRAAVARAKGLGGRKRQAASDLERARQSVSRAIHRAIRAISREHESLGRHLDVSLKIGDVLVYAPDRPVPWST